MKKLFISQPMRDKTDAEILAVRNKAIRSAERTLGEPVEVIDSFFQNAPHDAKPMWYLAKSLELLSTADVAFFAKGWDEYRGCRIENTCAVEYGITVIEDYSQEDGITEDAYRAAFDEVIEEELKDSRTQGLMKLMVPIVGTILAEKVARKLFNKEEENNG